MQIPDPKYKIGDVVYAWDKKQYTITGYAWTVNGSFIWPDYTGWFYTADNKIFLETHIANA